MARYFYPVVFLTILVSGCDIFESQSEICHPRGNDLQIFSKELAKRDVRFESNDRKGCITVFGLDESTLLEIRESIFGVTPPEGLHIGWPIEATGEVDGVLFSINESDRILKRLEEEKIKTKIMIYYGDEYLVWEEKDNEQVRKIINNQ